MANSRWLLTHQGICLAADGTLLDGQHRLLAIIQSNCSIEMMVTTGGNQQTQAATDVGICARSVGDMLHLMDGMKNATLRSSACRQIVVMCGHYQGYKMSVGITRMVHDEFKSEIDFLIESLHTFKPAYKGWIIGTLAFCLSADKRCAEFISKFGSGEDLKHTDAAKAARDWIVNGNSAALQKHSKRSAVESICNATYNSIMGNPIVAIKTGSRGVDYFMGKKRGFVESTRVQISQQMARRVEDKKQRRKANKETQ
jgi:hypothetical protein